MRRNLFTISAIILLFINHVNAQEIKIFTDSTTQQTSSELEFGFVYQYRNKEKKVGSYFDKDISWKKFKAFDLKVNGTSQTDQKFLKLDKKELFKNKGNLYVSYRHPNFPDIIHYDTLVYSYPKEVTILDKELLTNHPNTLRLKVVFNDGLVRTYEGSQLYYFLRNYGFSLTSENVRFIVSHKSLYGESNFLKTYQLSFIAPDNFMNVDEVNFEIDFLNKNEVKQFVHVYVKNHNYASINKLVLKYEGRLFVDFSGITDYTDSNYGSNGSLGKDVDVYVKEYNDSLFLITFLDDTDREEHYLINPGNSEIVIRSCGGDGGKGGDGSRGLNAERYLIEDATSEWEREYGASGGEGYRGGNGGHGGDVTIHYDQWFKPYLSLFSVINNGGAGGKGGYGGLGGYHQSIVAQKSKPSNSVISNRASKGKDGRTGLWGSKGKVNYVLLD